ERAASIHANNYILRECGAAHTSQPPAPLESVLKGCPFWHQGDTALGLAKFALVLGMVLPMAVIILTITTGLPPSNSRSESTAVINGAGTTDLSGSTLEFVLKVQ